MGGVRIASWHRLVTAIALVSLSAAPASAQPAVAPPASAAVQAACASQSAAAQATADEVRAVPRATIELGGCVSDESGIDRVLVRWRAVDGATHGRICTDPSLIDGMWHCSWDASTVHPGRYVVELVAVDAAGNRGTFERTYDVMQEAAPADAPRDGADQADAHAPASAPSGDGDPSAVIPPSERRADDESEFSSVGALITQQLVGCERGGTPRRPTDVEDVVTQGEQARLVAACIRPALEVAGALDIVVVDDGLAPITITVLVPDQRVAAELESALTSGIAGVPTTIVLRAADAGTNAP